MSSHALIKMYIGRYVMALKKRRDFLNGWFCLLHDFSRFIVRFIWNSTPPNRIFFQPTPSPNGGRSKMCIYLQKKVLLAFFCKQ